MKTYLTIWFNSEGTSPIEVTDKLMSMGFRPLKGNYDYIYDWKKKTNTQDAINLAEQVRLTLKGCKVNYKIESL